MEIKVLIERLEPNGYKARAGEPFGVSAEGASPDEAMQNLREAVNRKMAEGATVATLVVPIEDNPWLRMAGTLKGNPLLAEWKQAMAEYRESVDQDHERL